MFEGLPYEELTSFVEVIMPSVTIPIHLFPPRVSIHIETHEIPSLSVNKNLLLDRREEIDNISDKPQLSSGIITWKRSHQHLEEEDKEEAEEEDKHPKKESRKPTKEKRE
jgi:hypothetical protein